MESFTWVGRRIVTATGDLSDAEYRQWRACLTFENLELTNEFDLFDPLNEEDDRYNDEIWVETWNFLVNGEILTIKDIYAWPGDNQMGAIFIGDDPTPILINSDTNLRSSRLDDASPILTYRTEFEHLRQSLSSSSDENGDPIEGCTEHPHCLQQYLKSEADFRARDN